MTTPSKEINQSSELCKKYPAIKKLNKVIQILNANDCEEGYRLDSIFRMGEDGILYLHKNGEEFNDPCIYFYTDVSSRPLVQTSLNIKRSKNRTINSKLCNFYFDEVGRVGSIDYTGVSPDEQEYLMELDVLLGSISEIYIDEHTIIKLDYNSN